jgi:CDP-paratose 2-epimerase
MKILVTGAGGLIGSEAVVGFAAQGHRIVGVENNMREQFFGPSGNTSWRIEELQRSTALEHIDLDIRDRDPVLGLFDRERFDAVIHCAAQPSHDRAAAIPFDDFDVNAVGTLNLLEANRRSSPEAPFVFMSTNKVYGDGPNEFDLVELDTRWDYASPDFVDGIAETMSIDHSTHSLFGVSKCAADLMVQEYGRYFDMPTCCLRGGCITGQQHSGVELHGFLSYLFKCAVDRTPYVVRGHKAKQVRDNIHAADVVAFMQSFVDAPRVSAVYNLGGGRANSISMLEAITRAEELTGQPFNWAYDESARIGDHICYISDLHRIRADYPSWKIEHDLDSMTESIMAGWQDRLRR